MTHFRTVLAHPPEVIVEQGENGVIYLSHPQALEEQAPNLIGMLDAAVRRFGDNPLLGERGPEGDWSVVTYRAFLSAVGRRAETLGRQGFRRGETAAILASNSVGHAVTAFAVMALGGVVAPLSPMHLAHAAGRSLLGDLISGVGAAWLVVDDRLKSAAVDAGLPSPLTLEDLAHLDGTATIDLADAASRLRPEHPAKIFFTSGTTGTPKAVVNTHAMLVAAASMVDAVSPRLPDDAPPVILDWLPWHHTYGGNINLHTTLLRGGCFFIDDGLPTPDRFARTLENLADIQPTGITNVPIAYPMLVAALDGDRSLARRVLANVRVCSFGGAALAPSVVADIQRIARDVLGETVMFGSGYGMTETGGIIALTYWPTERTDLLGLPLPGVTLKLVPHEGVYECRVAGPNLFGGYKDADARFDAQGFFPTGDLVRPAEPDDWSAGLIFESRLAEDFKLANGVFVRAGPLRESLLDALRPLAADLVVCGANRDSIGVIIWPADASSAEVGTTLRSRIQAFNADRTTASTRIARMALTATPPDAEEVTAKGTLNVVRVAQRRATEIDAMFRSPDAAL